MSTKSQLPHKKIYLGKSLTGTKDGGSSYNSKWNIADKHKLVPVEDPNVVEYITDFKPKTMTYAVFYEFTFGNMNGDIRVLRNGSLLTGTNEKLVGKSVADTIYYQDHILVGTTSGEIHFFHVDDHEFKGTPATLNIASGDGIKHFLYNTKDDKVYVIGKKKIYVINGTSISTGITFTTDDHTSMRQGVVYNKYIVVRAYSYETRVHTVMFWDRDTSSTTWSKEFSFADRTIKSMNVNNGTLYTLTSDSNISSSSSNYHREFAINTYTGGSFVEQKGSRMRIGSDVLDLSSAQPIPTGFIANIWLGLSASTTEETNKSGFILFNFDGYISQMTHIQPTGLNGSWERFLTGTFGYENGYPQFMASFLEIGVGYRYYKVSFDKVTKTFNIPSVYQSGFIGDSYDLNEITEWYATYPRLEDGMELKVSYRISDLDAFTEIMIINNNNQSSSTDINEDLFRKKLKQDLPKYQRIEFRVESTGGAVVFTSGIFNKEHNYE